MKTVFGIILIGILVMDLSAAHIHFHRRNHRLPRIEQISWKQIAAGGAAGGTLIAAYKISNGIEESITTVAKEDPETFTELSSLFAGLMKWLALTGLGFTGLWIWLKLRKDVRKGDKPHEG